MHCRLPGPLRLFSLKAFASFYTVNLAEAENSIESYQSIGAFFVRRLKPGARPVASAKVLHPADSVISAAGIISRGEMLQVKSRPYSVAQILASSARAQALEAGFFATYYLCPTDYHRVHSPVSGKIISVDHLPGRLWPVFKKSVESIANLFAVNERMVVTIETELGLVSVVFVGALNVGKIELAFDSGFSSQVPGVKEKRTQNYAIPISIQAGQELGLFQMGSTVVVFYPKAFESVLTKSRWESQVGQAVKVGSGCY